MSEETITDSREASKKSLREKLGFKDTNTAMWTLVTILLSVLIYLVIQLASMPYLSVGLFSLGLAPALAVIAVVGAIRGPVAGFLVGYFGELLVSIFSVGGIVTFTLYGVAYGILGLVTGLASYDFTNGRSLAKLSILSVIGMVFTALLYTVIGLFVEQVAVLVAIGFQLLPLLTFGIPSVFLLTPLFARAWLILSSRITWSIRSTGNA